MNKQLRVSIIIPVYNGEKYVEKAIKSAINQTYKNIEIIVVNDGSTDETSNICKKYSDKIKYFEKENGGVSSALNLAIKEMTGDYFSWLSHDDEYLPNKIMEEVNFLQKMPSNSIVYSNYNLIDYSDNLIKTILIDGEKVKANPDLALLNGFINGITLLIPKKAFDDCGLFDENLRCIQDYELWFKFLLNGYDFYHLPKVLANSRVHKEQQSETNPQVFLEGNTFWINVIKTYPTERIKKYYGKSFQFYSSMALFLASWNYQEAVDYCITKCSVIDCKEAEKLHQETSKLIKRNNPNLFHRIIKKIRRK